VRHHAAVGQHTHSVALLKLEDRLGPRLVDNLARLSDGARRTTGRIADQGLGRSGLVAVFSTMQSPQAVDRTKLHAAPEPDASICYWIPGLHSPGLRHPPGPTALCLECSRPAIGRPGGR